MAHSRHSNKAGGGLLTAELRDLESTAAQKIESLKETVSKSIRSRPLASILIAAGVGFLYGRLRKSPFEAALLSAGAGLVGGLMVDRQLLGRQAGQAFRRDHGDHHNRHR